MNRKLLQILTCLLLVLSITFVIGCDTPKEEQPVKNTSKEIMLDGRITLASLIAITEGHLSSLAQSLAILTKSPVIQSGTWESMKTSLMKVKEREIPAVIWYARPDGTYYSIDKGLTGKSLNDRPYFKRVLKGDTVIGELVVSHSTGRNTAIICIPILKGHTVIGALGASVYLDALSSRIKSAMSLPDNYLFYALDIKGVTAINSNLSLIFQDPLDRGNPQLTKAIKKILATKSGYAEYVFSATTRRVYYDVGPTTGWHFAFGLIED